MGPPPQPHSPLISSFPTSPLPLTSGSVPTMSGSGYGASAVPGDNSGVGAGPGPLRHPRPLTAADLHLQLEKEQEAVVNRLTRELSMLRAQHSASVVSTTSSSGLPDTADYVSANHHLSGPLHPAPQRRHHRTSSSTSNHSAVAPSLRENAPGWVAAGLSGSAISQGTPGIASHTSVPFFQATTDRAREGRLSRQNSFTSSIISDRRSRTSSPVPGLYGGDHQHYRQHSYSHTHAYIPTPSSAPALYGSDGILSPSAVATSRYEETAHHRAELESVKRENEALRRRIKELERVISARRQSQNGRTRSESVSTTASAGGVVRPGEGDEEVVRVGESARSVLDGEP
ncbi:hypothetical protein FGG08_006905 [Glutinoglossum americanum]|uniref:Uncharacterized protein n=1 Tax=Glutinoglossum americanum TaxID=1670608 RepID=A0A9P8KZW4_9PEZI|nr:hypothetical protein FGG08_006905 [Glutinoglossum americanum]